MRQIDVVYRKILTVIRGVYSARVMAGVNYRAYALRQRETLTSTIAWLLILRLILERQRVHPLLHSRSDRKHLPAAGNSLTTRYTRHLPLLVAELSGCLHHA